MFRIPYKLEKPFHTETRVVRTLECGSVGATVPLILPSSKS